MYTSNCKIYAMLLSIAPQVGGRRLLVSHNAFEIKSSMGWHQVENLNLKVLRFLVWRKSNESMPIQRELVRGYGET